MQPLNAPDSWRLSFLITSFLALLDIHLKSLWSRWVVFCWLYAREVRVGWEREGLNLGVYFFRFVCHPGQGVPFASFQNIKGFEAGWPALFTNIAKALGGLINRVKELDLLHGFGFGSHGETIPHLQSRNDTVWFFFFSIRWTQRRLLL